MSININPPKKLDKRVIRTRHAIQWALIDLIVERGYEDVTVQQILDRANVGRSTFYVHFRDKEEVFRTSLANMKIGLEHEWRSASTDSKPTERLGFTQPFLRHLDGNRHIWRAIVGREAGAITDRQMRRMLAELTRADLAYVAEPSPRIEAAVQTIVGSLMALVTWWLDCEIAMTADELNNLFLQLTLPGLENLTSP
jgi:AcrR family transcriptional regulator